MKTALSFALLLASTSATAQTQGDKLLHAGASAAVVDVVWAGCAALDQPLWVRLSAGVAAGAAAGLGKEGLDLAGFGTPDVGDLVFDAFGIGLGVAIALLVETFVDPPVDPLPP
ncbi:MAG: hypothetical protein Q8O67_10205 [Deltaproteobacteria bacterium]|nr:hypothetical protein [Deltaproteobacteria bacterium]